MPLPGCSAHDDSSQIRRVLVLASSRKAELHIMMHQQQLQSRHSNPLTSRRAFFGGDLTQKLQRLSISAPPQKSPLLVEGLPLTQVAPFLKLFNISKGPFLSENSVFQAVADVLCLRSIGEKVPADREEGQQWIQCHLLPHQE